MASISASLERIGVEHHSRGIAGEAIRREGVDLENADAAAHRGANSTRKPASLKEQFPVTIRLASGWPVRIAPA